VLKDAKDKGGELMDKFYKFIGISAISILLNILGSYLFDRYDRLTAKKQQNPI